MTPSDTAAASAPLAAFQAGWNAGDGARIAAAFTTDARFVNILGTVLNGREAIAGQHQFILDGIYRGTTAEFPVTTTRWLGPDHLLIGCDAELHGVAHAPPGIAPPADGVMRTRFTMVSERTPSGWLLAFAQNTVILPLPPH